jgi:hypothetical protein
MAEGTGSYANQLRLELCQRNRRYAARHAHVESYGSQPVIVYAPDGERHGNFFDAAYEAICARPEWMRRLGKIHTQARQSLPRHEEGRRWCELDSSTSSDALLMNVFCTPGVAESASVRHALGVTSDEPVFGWRARVPLRNGRLDRTEVDMRWGELLVEAKLTETDFQTQSSAVVEAYQDFDEVFDRNLLPRVELRTARQKAAVEFPEEFSQEWEAADASIKEMDARTRIANAYQAAIVTKGVAQQSLVPGYAGYQLIRNVLAAYSTGCSFCVLHDQRRPDLREAWFRVMAAVRHAEIRVQCKVLTWQELAALLPGQLQEFLERKYGIAT